MHASEHCTACSEPILSAYEHGGLDWACEACGDPAVLERVCGIEVLPKAAVDESSSWDSDE